MSYSTDVTIQGGFAVARTSKAGKTSYRGVLGAIDSGNRAERSQLGGEVFSQLVRNNNWRAVMREVTRVFPATSIKKASNVLFAKDELHFMETDGDRVTLTRWDAANPCAASSHAYFAAVLEVTASKELKGEKLLYSTRMAGVLKAASERLTAQIAEAMELAERAD